MSELQKIKDLMDRKYEELKVELQAGCIHEEISDWMEEWWAIAHTTGYIVKQCKRCGKEMERVHGWMETSHDEDNNLIQVPHIIPEEEIKRREVEQEEELKQLKELYEKDVKEGRL